jgi:hypothetical protein
MDYNLIKVYKVVIEREREKNDKKVIDEEEELNEMN